MKCMMASCSNLVSPTDTKHLRFDVPDGDPYEPAVCDSCFERVSLEVREGGFSARLGSEGDIYPEAHYTRPAPRNRGRLR